MTKSRGINKPAHRCAVADLLRVLANLMEGMVPIKTFGPPGDWGYDTEIGRAVIALRQGTCAGEGDRSANA